MTERQYRRDLAPLALRKVATVLFGVSVSILLARHLSVDDRGLYGVVYSGVSVGLVVLNLGVNVVFQDRFRDVGASLVPYYVGYSVVSFSVAIVGGIVAFLFQAWIVAALAALVGISTFRMQLGHIVLITDVRWSFLIGSSTVAFQAVLLGVLVVSGTMNLYTALLAFAARELVAVIALLFVLPGGKLRDGTWTVFRDLGSGGISAFGVTLLVVLNYRLDVLMLAPLGVPSADLAIFVVGVSIAEYIWVVSDVFKDVATTRSARGTGSEDAIRSAQLGVASVLPLIAAFAVLGRWLVPLVYGAPYASSFTIAIPLMFASLMMIYCKVLGTYSLSNAGAGQYAKTMALAVSVNALLNLALVPRLGINGAVAATLVSYSVAGFGLISTTSRSTGTRVTEILSVRPAISALLPSKLGGKDS